MRSALRDLLAISPFPSDLHHDDSPAVVERAYELALALEDTAPPDLDEVLALLPLFERTASDRAWDVLPILAEWVASYSFEDWCPWQPLPAWGPEDDHPNRTWLADLHLTFQGRLRRAGQPTQPGLWRTPPFAGFNLGPSTPPR